MLINKKNCLNVYIQIFKIKNEKVNLLKLIREENNVPYLFLNIYHLIHCAKINTKYIIH
jgi:16S rRNA G527 N7-methylase RsmG